MVSSLWQLQFEARDDVWLFAGCNLPHMEEAGRHGSVQFNRWFRWRRCCGAVNAPRLMPSGTAGTMIWVRSTLANSRSDIFGFSSHLAGVALSLRQQVALLIVAEFTADDDPQGQLAFKRCHHLPKPSTGCRSTGLQVQSGSFRR